jgi:hypothetical protein
MKVINLKLVTWAGEVSRLGKKKIEYAYKYWSKRLELTHLQMMVLFWVVRPFGLVDTYQR